MSKKNYNTEEMRLYMRNYRRGIKLGAGAFVSNWSGEEVETEATHYDCMEPIYNTLLEKNPYAKRRYDIMSSL